MKKNDLFLIVILLAIASGFLIFFNLNSPGGELKTVQISEDGQIIATYPLNEDRTQILKLQDGTNTLVIQEQKVFVSQADCDNQICVHTAPISEIGETIACLPHQLIIEIIPGD